MDRDERIQAEAKLIGLIEEHFTLEEIKSMRDFSIGWDLLNSAFLRKLGSGPDS